MTEPLTKEETKAAVNIKTNSGTAQWNNSAGSAVIILEEIQ